MEPVKYMTTSVSDDFESVKPQQEKSVSVDAPPTEKSMRKRTFHIPDDAEVPYKWDMHHFRDYTGEISAPDANLNVDLTSSETDAIEQDYKGQAFRAVKHNINTRRSLWLLQRRNGWKAKTDTAGKPYKNFSDYAKRRLGFKTLAHCYAMIAWTDIERSLLREVSPSIADWIRNEHLRALNEIKDDNPEITERMRIMVFKAARATSEKDKARFTGELIRDEAVKLGLLEAKAKPKPEDVAKSEDAGDAERVVIQSPACKALRVVTRPRTGGITLHVSGPGPYWLTAEELTTLGATDKPDASSEIDEDFLEIDEDPDIDTSKGQDAGSLMPVPELTAPVFGQSDLRCFRN